MFNKINTFNLRFLADFLQFLPGANFVQGAFGVYFVVDIQYIWAAWVVINYSQTDNDNRSDNRTDNNVRAPKTAMSACGRERKPQYRIEIYPNTETAVPNGKKVAVLKTIIPLLNRRNMFMSVFPNQGASILRVR